MDGFSSILVVLMRTSYLALGVGSFLTAAILVDYFKPDTTPPPPPAGPIPLTCERACLEDVVDQFIDAMVSKDPDTLPLSADLRVTENSQMLDFGDGSWLTITGRGSYAHYFADPALGESAFMGTMAEGDNLILMALRLRIELGRITEVEMFTNRVSADPADLFDGLAEPESTWFAAIAPSERPGRPEMIAVANAYFETLQTEFGLSNRLFTPDCYKVENGTSLPCDEDFEETFPGALSRIHQRRFPLVDDERGVVWTYSVRDHDGTQSGAKPAGTGGSDVEVNRVPRSFYAIDAFLIEGGLIRGIETIIFPAPYHSGSPWEGGLSGR